MPHYPKTMTIDDLPVYVGGQAEIQNPGEGYLYRGTIKEIRLEGSTLKIGFTWLAKGVGYPPVPTSWVRDEKLTYEAAIAPQSVSDMGPGREGGSRLLAYTYSGEMVLLIPPDGGKLEEPPHA